MVINTIDDSQRWAARLVGFSYLFGFISIFNEMYVRETLIVSGNPLATAQNIVAHEQLFRLGIVTDLLCFASIAGVATGSYLVLKPFGKVSSLLAMAWRMVEAVVTVVTTFSSLYVLRLLTYEGFSPTFSSEQVQTLALMFRQARSEEYSVALIFLGLGSTIFAFLWFKSRYVPRALAAWGIFASLLVAAVTLGGVLSPAIHDMSFPAGYLPIAIYELTMGFWLSIRGLSPSEGAKEHH